MRTLIAALVLVGLLGTNVCAETFYLKNREKFTGKIIEETEEVYKVQKDDENYSVFFKSHEVKKLEIFAVLDDSGNIIFPPDLKKSILAVSAEKLSDREYQNYLLSKRVEEQERLNDSVSDIRTILFVQLVLILGLGVFAAFAS